MKTISWLACIWRHPLNPGYGGETTAMQLITQKGKNEHGFSTHMWWNYDIGPRGLDWNPNKECKGLEE